VGGNLISGGNFLPYFSRNHAGHGESITNVDDAQPSDAGAVGVNCAPLGSTWVDPVYIGHGTHVAGLAAANLNAATGVQGTCKNCGLAMHKISFMDCVLRGTYQPELDTLDFEEVGPVLEDAVGTGVQVVNMSFGTRESLSCAPNGTPLHALCLALDIAAESDVLVVASAGNRREVLNFPAREPDVVSVGGTFLDGFTFWDDFPNCPLGFQVKQECASNYSSLPSVGYLQEVVSPAKLVYSTMPAGKNWNPSISCGDSYGPGGSGDGAGTCSGTSMSSPQVAGVYGALRSINPLVRAGAAFPSVGGGTVRSVMIESSSRSTAGVGWHTKLGFGVPDSRRAVEKMLGRVRKDLVANRVTPLFRLYSPGSLDYAAVSTPQLAIALSLFQSEEYKSTNSKKNEFLEAFPIPGYTTFPNTAAGSPRAAALVLTTEYKSQPEYPDLVALHLLDRPSVGTNRDLVLLSSESVANSALAAGYQYGGRQGYLYSDCSPYPACRPPGTERLHLKCVANGSDCAVLLDAEVASFAALGYNTSFPGMTSSVLGLAYPVIDSDGDGLPDGLEREIGTDPAHVDSDRDGAHDGVEYPFAGVPVSDPCEGLDVQCPRPPSYIFEDDFE